LKPTIVYILLALLAYQLAGSMVTNYLQIEAVRKEVKSKLKSTVPPNELTVIQLNNSESNALTWVRANKEFIYKGKMYDVVSKSIYANSIRYVCITDTQEEALFKHLDDLVNMSSHAKKSVLKLQNASEYLSINYSLVPNMVFSYSKKTANFRNESTVSRCPEVETPPPNGWWG
jgi:c-di-AMP phosphodiesterase-like protein